MTNRFLEGFVVLFCGIDEPKRTKAREVIVRYGGKWVDKYSKEVTCGIVGRVGSTGFKELRKAKVQLLQLKWLQDCILNRSLVQMEAPKYKVEIFTGLEVVCTQLLPDERNRVKTLVEAGGGTYSDRLVAASCTHLIAKTPEGDKYVGAKKFGTVHIVTMAWVEECAKQKAWVPELEFSVDFLAKQAQREAHANKLKRAAALQAATVSKASRTDAVDVPLVERIENYLIKEMKIEKWPPLFQSMRTDKSNVFEDEVVWIHGYTQEVTDYLTASIIMGGGLRSMVLCDTVTIAILGEKAHISDWTLVHRHPCGVPLANAVWVIEQLHPFPVLFSLLEEITSLAEFLQFLEVEKIPSSPINESRDDVVIECRSSVTGRIRLNSMENVCTVFELYRNREKTRKQ